MQWEQRSGTTFESSKTVLMHFTRAKLPTYQLNYASVIFKGEVITPSLETKILGLIMDTRLRYKSHVARTATKALKAALALKRLRMLSPHTARQLFDATVAPAMDYASNIWMHTIEGSNNGSTD